ncbi:MAG: NAD(P)H-hydrate dehydratase [Candidatus Dormibacteraeota bacterium]|nr:NAD(P)H-hydrate dehydratase [Candidatus Dormibacteraeota bacterium]
MRVGIDVVNVERIAQLLQRSPRFATRVYTDRERSISEGKPERFASRWAAKEAVRKLFGSSGEPMPGYGDIEVTGGANTAPGISIRGKAQDIALSLTHDAGIAIAVVADRRHPRGPALGELPEHLRLPERTATANKGTFGRVLVVAGSRGFTGAPQLAARGAARAGAGLVTVAVPESIHAVVAAGCLEVMPAPLPDGGSGVLSRDALDPLHGLLTHATSLVVGPGIGRDAATWGFLEQVLSSLSCPAVIDADALNLAAAAHFDWRRSPSPLVLTPHPAEMARLTGMSTEQVQEQRQALARRFAADNGVTLVLKGSETVVAAADGRCHVDNHSVVALATGGTGDVLSGVIAAFIAQGLEPFEAAVAGVTVHAHAGLMVQARQGRAGALASDVIEALPRAQERIRRALETAPTARR